MKTLLLSAASIALLAATPAIAQDASLDVMSPPETTDPMLETRRDLEMDAESLLEQERYGEGGPFISIEDDARFGEGQLEDDGDDVIEDTDIDMGTDTGIENEFDTETRIELDDMDLELYGYKKAGHPESTSGNDPTIEAQTQKGKHAINSEKSSIK